MNFDNYSNEQLHSQTLSLTERERIVTTEVLWHLREIERRMLYAQMGYRDLKEYCVKELKYSEGSAWRRISAMRLLKELPTIEAKIQTGQLNITQITLAQAHFREVKPTLEEKQELLLQLVNQSTRATERILAECKPEPFKPLPLTKEKALRGQKVEVTFILEEDFLRELEELQILLGKPSSKLELFKSLALEKLSALRAKAATKVKPVTSVRSVKTEKCDAQPAPKPTRYISQATLRTVKARDGNQCQFRDQKTNRQCEARHHLQIEHIQPFAKGGENNTSNLQQLCPAHNRWRAVAQFGAKKMRNYVPTLR